MESLTGEEQVRNRLLLRIVGLELQCTERLTPLLQKQLQKNIKTHTEALEQPSLSVELLESLDDLNEQFEEHWEAFHRDYKSHMKLLVQMTGIENLIRGTLAGDYLGIARRNEVEHSFELDMAALIHTERSGVGDSSSKK